MSGYNNHVPPFQLTLILLAGLIRQADRPLKAIKAPKAPKAKAPAAGKSKQLTKKVTVTLLVTGY